MDFVLRIMSGPEAGNVFRLKPGETIVGRGAKAQVKLAAESVSWEHAAFLRNGEEVVVENLSAKGTFVNGAKITGKVRLRIRDEVRLSDEVLLRLESADGSGGGLLERHRKAVFAVAGLVMLAFLLALWNPFRASSGEADWNKGYAVLLPWVQEKSRASRDDPYALPAQFEDFMQEGWRLDKTRNYKDSAENWFGAQVLLIRPEAEGRYDEASRRHPAALARILKSKHELPTPADDEEYAAALRQWVQLRLEYAARNRK